MSNWLVGATDPRAFSTLKEESIACFDMKTNLPQGEWPWGSPSFKSLGPHKIELIFKAISWGFEIVITDIDALVLREPFAFMARWPNSLGKVAPSRGSATARHPACSEPGACPAGVLGCSAHSKREHPPALRPPREAVMRPSARAHA